MTLVVLPLALFWLHDPNWFLNPERRVGVFSNVDAWASQNPGQPVTFWNILLHQLWLATGMFTIYDGPFIPFGDMYAPALDQLTGWILFPAIGYALYRERRPLVALTLIWFFAIWFTGVVLSHDAPQLEHAVGLIPTVFVLIALLCDHLGAAIIRRTRRPTLYAGLTGLLALVSGVLNYNVFFNVWGGQLAGSKGFAWQIYDAATYVARHNTPHGTAIYAQSYPDEFFRFLSPHAGEFPATGVLPHASLYIVMPDSPIPVDAVSSHLPGARLERVYDVDGDLAFTALIPHAPVVTTKHMSLQGACIADCGENRRLGQGGA